MAVMGAQESLAFHLFRLKKPSAIMMAPEPPPIMRDFVLPVPNIPFSGGRRLHASSDRFAQGGPKRYGRTTCTPFEEFLLCASHTYN
eukprot:4887707-Pyramimonas_sp.AAC.2